MLTRRPERALGEVRLARARGERPAEWIDHQRRALAERFDTLEA